MDVDDDEAETDEETHAIPAAGRVAAAEAAQHINGAAGWEVRHALKPTKRIPSEEEGHQKPDQKVSGGSTSAGLAGSTNSLAGTFK